MKTLKELYDEILASDELKKEFAGCAANEQDTAAFLEKYGCDATVEELKEFIKEKMAENMAKISEEKLAAAAGGTDAELPPEGELALSFTTIFGCIVYSMADKKANCL